MEVPTATDESYISLAEAVRILGLGINQSKSVLHAGGCRTRALLGGRVTFNESDVKAIAARRSQ